MEQVHPTIETTTITIDLVRTGKTEEEVAAKAEDDTRKVLLLLCSRGLWYTQVSKSTEVVSSHSRDGCKIRHVARYAEAEPCEM